MKNCQESIFDVRTYGRTELAMLYCPYLKPESAYRRLMKWIEISPQLSAKLLRNGKPMKVRNFTPSEVKLIVDYLGEP